MKTQRALLALSLWLTACVPTSTTAYPVPPTQGYPGPATATVAPTAVPTTATPPTETPEPTATTEPEVWEIWFHGYFCGVDTTFCDGPGFELKHYSIQSDGSELKEISAFDIPSASDFELSPGAPPIVLQAGMVSPPQYSSDESHLLYLDTDLKLRNLHLRTGGATQLYDALPLPSRVGPYCWTNNEARVIFFESRRGRGFTAPIIYAVNPDGSSLQEFYKLNGLEGLQYGDCAPNRGEAVLAVLGESIVSGLYIVNFDSGDVRQILSRYSVEIVIAAPNQ